MVELLGFANAGSPYPSIELGLVVVSVGRHGRPVLFAKEVTVSKLVSQSSDNGICLEQLEGNF
ncbi:hypothetical protein HAX54_004912 [Datura stramonium]|uniref:Uncharacterized protein n=1 Tax=Datura stramonium TaxID=4076 RepID=A0ABS8T914_DATST|nr:hypothetical protein [Datura stramonium]